MCYYRMIIEMLEEMKDKMDEKNMFFLYKVIRAFYKRFIND